MLVATFSPQYEPVPLKIKFTHIKTRTDKYLTDYNFNNPVLLFISIASQNIKATSHKRNDNETIITLNYLLSDWIITHDYVFT